MDPLWATFLVFLVSLFLCHLPIIRVRRKGRKPDDTARWKRNWERTDYVYLGLAALALIPAANEVRRITGGTQLQRVLEKQGVAPAFTVKENIRHCESLNEVERDRETLRWLKAEAAVLDAGELEMVQARRLFEDHKGDEAIKHVERARDGYRRFLESHV